MTDLDLDDPRTVAYHEAGHAVAYLLHRLPFRYVTVRPRTAGLTGHVMIWRPRRMSAYTYASVAAAGPVAEARHLQELGLDEDEVTARIIFGGCAADFDQQDVPGYPVGWFERVMTDVLTEHWPVVERVAEALAEQGTLSGRQVQQLMDRGPAGGHR
ncbi:Peptidase family M41 [Actinopolymorpha cephalotaxi]|uniref:ATP-dependent Zn protease n=1 Tax=Actinopolymorpha cephalotaxi TaxID=504797 RepID=A0A1I2UR87_9ACTN|nr:hypothetical protein [Actinopolymorpha cephalotaxi]NYH86654.1 ATP-dependent Zn protease [Actinopolymorpha cephalotaxi]SFG78257.1 Peptidase family M41 [Actinopolymorpha cephalotaxi]